MHKKAAINLLQESVEVAEETARLIPGQLQSDFSGLQVALYLSLLELASAMLSLCQSNLHTALRPVFRTFLETFVAFRNLREFPEYGYSMQLAWQVSRKKLGQSANSGGNEFLNDLKECLKSSNNFEDPNLEIQRLKKLGAKDLKISERFEKAGMRDVYDSVYNLVCGDAHSSFESLLNRHIENGQLVMYREHQEYEIDAPLLTSTAYLNEASLFIAQSFSTEQTQAIENQIASFVEFCETRRKVKDSANEKSA
jgi:Family of unknown function (DUF5677)